MIDIQNEASDPQDVEAAKVGSGSKRERTGDADSEDVQDSMDVDEGNDDSIVPLPTSGGIQDLRERLQAKMDSLRRGAQREDRDENGEAGSKDELLEERRRHRALLREKRRKETQGKKRGEREKKGNGRERGQGKQEPAKV